MTPGLPRARSAPHYPDLDHAGARAIPFEEQNRTRWFEGQLALHDRDRHPRAEKTCTQVRSGVPSLAVRPSQVVVPIWVVLRDQLAQEGPHVQLISGQLGHD